MTDWIRAYWPHVFGSVVAAVVGAPAAVASYRHGMAVIERNSDPVMASWLPMTTDGLLLAALVALWARRLTRRSTGRAAWAAFGLGLVATTATNLAGARTYVDRAVNFWDVVEAVGWAVWPPICLAVVLEIIAWIVVPDRPLDAETGQPAGQTVAKTDARPPVDQRKLTDEEIVAEVRDKGIEPSRKVLHRLYGVGSGRADRIRSVVEGPADSPVRLVREEATG